jgi:hypothetical protein
LSSAHWTPGDRWNAPLSGAFHPVRATGAPIGVP